ncbi:MAG: methyltransferase domain-containing protein [Trebonia sp.]
MTELTDPWADRSFLRGVQYRTDANLAARQSIYAYQEPHIDLRGRVIDLAAPAAGETVCDVGCGNGTYLAELARRGFAGRVLGLDLSTGMLAAARERLDTVSAAGGPGTANSAGPLGSSAAADPARAVGLLAADATALPLRDGAADLTFALHMLYHVPDPSRAVRELRRVTRPGGRVVIVLNGSDHLQELRRIVADARGEEIWGQRERLRLDGGEAMARSYFPTVTRHDFVSELRIPSPEPVADYVRSMSGTQQSADPDRLVASALSRFPAAPGAVFTVTTHAGCLICTV